MIFQSDDAHSYPTISIQIFWVLPLLQQLLSDFFIVATPNGCEIYFIMILNYISLMGN